MYLIKKRLIFIEQICQIKNKIGALTCWSNSSRTIFSLLYKFKNKTSVNVILKKPKQTHLYFSGGSSLLNGQYQIDKRKVLFELKWKEMLSWLELCTRTRKLNN